MTSRRKRGPVSFRPRLSAGLALSLLSLKRSTNGQIVQSINLSRVCFEGLTYVRFGSKAASFHLISIVAASGRIAAIQDTKSGFH